MSIRCRTCSEPIYRNPRNLFKHENEDIRHNIEVLTGITVRECTTACLKSYRNKRVIISSCHIIHTCPATFAPPVTWTWTMPQHFETVA